MIERQRTSQLKIDHTWTNAACVYLLETGMTIGNRARLAPSASPALPITLGGTLSHIEADCVRVTFPSINTLRVTWRDGSPVGQGTITYSGAFLIVEC
ncbi:MAG: hypothetical protein R2867_34355 [Caldilineaceae bacterium]